MTPLDISHRRTILRTYLLVVLLTAMARGRPRLDFEYLMSANFYPIAPGSEPKQSKDVISDPSEPAARNPWLSLVESSLYHHGEHFSSVLPFHQAGLISVDSHVPKAIRSLVHYDSKYGSLPLAEFIGARNDGGEEVLPGIAKADGTIFIRGAGLVMDALGWCREGQKEGSWEFSPIGYDEVWRN